MSGATSIGEAGGIVAAVIALLAVAGKGVNWLAGWAERRESGRVAKLQAWHDELQRREADFDQRLDRRLGGLEAENTQRATENSALRMAFELVASALRSIDPRNTALSRAEQILQTAFPLMPIVPPDMTADLKTIDRKDQAATAAARATGGTA